nr:hypothetical protein [Tanacetum cinerariifolium]
MILELVKHGPLIWQENGVTRTKKYVKLSTAEKIQADCDMKATNIILQDSGLAVLIFSLENDPTVCLNKAMAFLTAVASSRGDKGNIILVLVIRAILLVPRETMQVDRQGLLNAITVKLHAYLEQHELHAIKVRLLREHNQDPLAFFANQQMTPPHFNTYQSSYNNSQLQQQFSPSQYGSIHPTQHY